MFIHNFAHRAHHLVKLTRKGATFKFGADQITAQEDLKLALLLAPTLQPLDYSSELPVILAVDTSYIAVGFFLCQCDLESLKAHNYNCFGSITLNKCEAQFSQPKLEIYGLFRALRALRLWIIGVRNLVVETDGRYIKGMLANPDIQPLASINCWIVSILTFHFTLVHVKGTFHGPDGLSQRPRQPGNPDEDNDEEEFDDWINCLHGFVHMIQGESCTFYSLPPVQCLSASITGAQISSIGEGDTYDIIP
jgi:hypothetical protein